MARSTITRVGRSTDTSCKYTKCTRYTTARWCTNSPRNSGNAKYTSCWSSCHATCSSPFCSASTRCFMGAAYSTTASSTQPSPSSSTFRQTAQTALAKYGCTLNGKHYVESNITSGYCHRCPRGSGIGLILAHQPGSPVLSLSGGSNVTPGSVMHLHGRGFSAGGGVVLSLDHNLSFAFSGSSATKTTSNTGGAESAASLLMMGAEKSNQSSALNNTIKVSNTGIFDVPIVVLA